MSKQVMDINVLADFIANTFDTSQVLVEKNNRILTIEPLSMAKADCSINNQGQHPDCQDIGDDKTKAGAFKLEDFTDIRFSTKNLKFDREDANARR
jgi:virulence-associated protein VagC